MTRESRENLVVVAVVLSLALHLGLMFLARPRVMTHVVRSQLRTTPRAISRVSQRPEQPLPTGMAELEDIEALKDAPEVVGPTDVPEGSLAATAIQTAAKADVPELVAPDAPPVDAALFDTRPVDVLETTSPQATPRFKLDPYETAASVAPAAASAPVASPIAPKVTPRAEPPKPAAVLPIAPTFEQKIANVEQRSNADVFKPAQEIYEVVEEKIVNDEKKAVRALLDGPAVEAFDLDKSVNVSLVTATQGNWTYFKVMVVPRHTLPVVPKDVVVLIDGSGSIGDDRFGSCRKAARRILRTVTNSDDRFNLVVFRNRYAYAFRSWRPCDAKSFVAADNWLSSETAHGRTDVFSTISSVLTLPRDPKRPLIALVVTDGEANEGVSNTSDILAKFTALNDGLVSVYMYGVKSSANRTLIDVLTHGNRGESLIFEGTRWHAGEGLSELSERFRDPVLSDLRLVFAASCPAETYPRLLRNLYRSDTLAFYGRVPKGTRDIAFSLKGLNGAKAHESYFVLPVNRAPQDASVVAEWTRECRLGAQVLGR